MDESAPPEAAKRTLAERIRDRFPSFTGTVVGLDGQVVWVLLTGAVILVFFRKFGGSGYFENYLRPQSLASHADLTLFGDFYWFLTSFFCLGFIPLLVLLPRFARPKNLGLGLGDWRFAVKVLVPAFVVMVIVVVIASRFSVFWQYYPLNHMIGTEAAHFIAGTGKAPEAFLSRFVAYELLYALYFVGWEFFFRGFLLFGLYDRLGINGIFIGNIPFALLHVAKPFPEALGSIIAGVALGLFALRTRSFWYPWLIHVSIAWTMDLCAIQRRAESILDKAGG